MRRIRIICPTRQRAARCELMLESFFATRGSEETKMFCYVATDDPEIDAYRTLFQRLPVEFCFGKRLPITEAINLSSHHADFYGEVNDDHVYRTQRWDIALSDAILKSGKGAMAYGHTNNLPSAVMVSASCVKSMGWFMPPGFQHQFVDNALYDLYSGAGRLHHVPEVWIEHCHPDYGKAPMDATYELMRDTWDQGKARYQEWALLDKQRHIDWLKTSP